MQVAALLLEVDLVDVVKRQLMVGVIDPIEIEKISPNDLPESGSTHRLTSRVQVWASV